MNDIVSGSNQLQGGKYSGVPAESFCNCEPERMNIALVLGGRRDGAKAAGFFKGGMKV